MVVGKVDSWCSSFLMRSRSAAEKEGAEVMVRGSLREGAGGSEIDSVSESWERSWRNSRSASSSRVGFREAEGVGSVAGWGSLGGAGGA